MGFRFNLEAANIVANLTFNRTDACMEDICSSVDALDGFLGFLYAFPNHFFSLEDIAIRRRVGEVRESFYQLREVVSEDIDYAEIMNNPVYREAKRGLEMLAQVLSRCPVKVLLLPSMHARYSDEYIVENNTLQELLHMTGRHSCLFLQPIEGQLRKASIFNAFPHFEIALRHADLWPAIFVWKDDNYVFIPVRSRSEIIELIYMIQKHPEQIAMSRLQYISRQRIGESHYIIQLSDLHFGTKDAKKHESRLKQLIDNQISTFMPDDSYEFVITGDMTNSPIKSQANIRDEFFEHLTGRYNKEPIWVLGNHDINNMGLAIINSNQHLANTVSDYPRIVKLDREHIALLLFNSNTEGEFAKGKIGTEQMAKMGNKLDRERHNLEGYMLIAVLHHHLFPIERPSFYDQPWYKKLLGRFQPSTVNLIDANLFVEWLRERNIHIVLHGHEHIPNLDEKEGMTVIGCGSSTGHIKHKDKDKTYLSYNLIKISNGRRIGTCSLFAEEILGTGAKNIETVVL